jgi:hypothetical protein
MATNPEHEAGMEEQASGRRDWDWRWSRFLTQHQPWWEQVGRDGPVYALPDAARDALTESARAISGRHRSKKPLLTEGEAAAEKAFLVLCREYAADAVGVWDGLPVHYPPLGPPPPPVLSPALFQRLGWGQGRALEGVNAALSELMRRADQARHQLLGYAGWLTFNPDFQAEKATLRAQYAGLEVRPSWPLSASTHDRQPVPVPPEEAGTVSVLPDATARFLDRAGQFLRNWQLMRLVSWELPLPQGVLDQVPLGLAVQLLGPDHLVQAFPTYANVPSEADVRESIWRQQRFAAREAGIAGGGSLAGISGRSGRASAHETAFRLWLVEQAARARYGDRRGLVTRLTAAFKIMTGKATHYVNELRGMYHHLIAASTAPR